MDTDITHSEIDTTQAPDAYLLPDSGDSLCQPVPVTPKRATVGRSSYNTIVLPTNTVSRKHAIMISREGDYYVKDLDSRNGTFINDDRISVSKIRHRDRISFGDQVFIFLRRFDKRTAGVTRTVLDADSTIMLSRDEFEPTEILACPAESARLEFFPDAEELVEPASPSSSDRHISLLDRLRGRQPADAPPDVAGETKQTTTQAHQRLSLLYRMSERLRMTQEPKTIMVDGLDLILEAIPSADRAVLFLRSGSGSKLEVAASRSRDPENQDATIQISRTLIDWVLTEKMALMTPDVSGDVRFKDSESIRLNPFNALICVPVIVTGTVIGILYVDSGNLQEQMTREDVAFTAAMAKELALTIVNIRLQKTALRSERMAAIGLTISNLAHNIKNLIMLNQNAMDLMQIHLDRIGDEKADKCWQMIGNGFTRIIDLSAEMLDYSREQELAPTPTDVNRTIRESTMVLAQNLSAKGVRLDFDLAESLPEWEIDAKQFQRALVNLVVNAVDAIGKKTDGEIGITTACDKKRRLVVAVRDNGCGIDPEKRKKIFELFFTTKGTSGSGLGLPMVNKFVQSSGGNLLVESEKGVGTTFKMVFPQKG